ncbi:uncharacterized protein PG986_004534 [Apiospora aurea]|uniref:Secreted protein n=1 Tax=Apiospora aurea TaxID=335848 RepID=A0ABR1QNM6_9PEZI
MSAQGLVTGVILIIGAQLLVLSLTRTALLHANRLDVFQLHRARLLLLDLHGLSCLLSQIIILKLQSEDLCFGLAQLHLKLTILVESLVDVVGIHVELSLEGLNVEVPVLNLDTAAHSVMLLPLLDELLLRFLFLIAKLMIVDAFLAFEVTSGLLGALLLAGSGILVLVTQILQGLNLLLCLLVESNELGFLGLGSQALHVGKYCLPRGGMHTGAVGILCSLNTGILLSLFIKTVSFEPVTKVLGMTWSGCDVGVELTRPGVFVALNFEVWYLEPLLFGHQAVCKLDGVLGPRLLNGGLGPRALEFGNLLEQLLLGHRMARRLM